MTVPFYLVVGLGKTGQSIARYLERRQQPFAVFDTRPNPPGVEAFKEAFPKAPLFLETLPDDIYEKTTELITSPGVSLDNPFIIKAKAHSIPIIGDIECLAREIKAPIVAITGTNGKSTVTTLIGEMAKEARLSVAVAGNIGIPVLDLLDDGVNYDLWVLELSSFQLDLTKSLVPTASTILNISPDHLDRHHNLDNYINAKQSIFKNSSYIIYNREDIHTKPKIIQDGQKVESFGLNEPSLDSWGLLSKNDEFFLAFGEDSFVSVQSLKIKGKHNWQNALAAMALANAVGIGREAIYSVLSHFCGLPHRCQWVRTIDGVEWINDSKGTNIGATISAIMGIGSSIQGKIILIAGGVGKGADFHELRPAVKGYVHSAVLIGTDAPKIEESLADLVPVFSASSFEEAILLAKQAAKKGDVVLLSPACASLDMFKDFNHRGERFTELVHQL